MKGDFKERLALKAAEAERIVVSYLPPEEGYQKTIFESCNYSVKNGGKRLRPVMLSEAYLLVSGKDELSAEDMDTVGPFMAAIEMIHSSSLVHDDLPCMDNDVLRRGKPSTWARYGEDMGTLAGDGLMIYAFETAVKSTAEPVRKLEAIKILARKTGIYGMIGGQTVDVELTGKKPSEDQLDFIYRLKTGALIEAAFTIGAVLAGADPQVTAALSEAALSVGMAFQIRDDILDVTADEAVLGKPVNSDKKNDKTTWLTYFDPVTADKDVRKYSDIAAGIIGKLGGNSFLSELIEYLTDRKV